MNGIIFCMAMNFVYIDGSDAAVAIVDCEPATATVSQAPAYPKLEIAHGDAWARILESWERGGLVYPSAAEGAR